METLKQSTSVHIGGYRAPLEIRKTLSGILKTKGYIVEIAETSSENFKEAGFQQALVGVRLSGMRDNPSGWAKRGRT